MDTVRRENLHVQILQILKMHSSGCTVQQLYTCLCEMHVDMCGGIDPVREAVYTLFSEGLVTFKDSKREIVQL